MLKQKRLIILLSVLCLLCIHGSAAGQSFYAFLQSEEDEYDICSGDSVEARIGFWGGSPPYTVEISGENGVYKVFKEVESSFDFHIVPEDDDLFYISQVTDSRGRKGKAFGDVGVTVHEATPVTLIMEPTAFLESDPPVELSSSPPGATFSGKGVKGIMFDPGTATPVGSPHRIRCSYFNEYGCASTDQQDVFVLYGISEVVLLAGGDPVQIICGTGSTYTIRGSNQDEMAGTFSLYDAGTGTRINGHISDPDPGDNQAVLNPEGLEGSYTIRYVYGIQDLEVSTSADFQVSEIQVTGITGLPDTVCKNSSPLSIAPEVNPPNPEGIYQISGPGVSGNQSDGYVFAPDNPEVPEGTVSITLEFTSSAGCHSVIDVAVYVEADPELEFGIGEHCVEPAGSDIPFLNLSGNRDVVIEWAWDFGDPESGAENTSSLEYPVHQYGEAGPRTIRLTAYTAAGCTYWQQMDTLLFDTPVPGISWSGDCFSDEIPVEFFPSYSSEYAPVDTLLWLIQTAENEVLALEGRQPDGSPFLFGFPGSGTYEISLLAENEAGCSGLRSEWLFLRPLYGISQEGFTEGFGGVAPGWNAGSLSGHSSWILGTPDFHGFRQKEDDLAWYTDLPEAAGGPTEYSWISSPCFDLSGMQYPVIELDIMKSFVPGVSGAVVQFTRPDSITWNTLGTSYSGKNWYNDSTIQLKPGESNIGWSLPDFHPDSQWVRAMHPFDKGTGDSLVRFRIAFASDGTQEQEPGRFNQGLAFDNFTIRERTLRHSVLEYFTNIAGPVINPADSAVKAYAAVHSGKLYDLHFHMDIPVPDPLNMQNPGPPMTRSFYYGIPDVPYAVLNGGAAGEYRFNLSEEPVLEDQPMYKSSDEVPLFELMVHTDYYEDHLSGSVTLACLDQAYGSLLQLYIVILENEVTRYPELSYDSAFRNVVLDMVPSPAGILIDETWQPGKVLTFDFDWEYADLPEDIEDLSVVSFIQERNEGWILQAGKSSYQFGVGMPEHLSSDEAFILFPNPARTLLNIRLAQEPRARGMLKVTDLSGREILLETTVEGKREYQLDIEKLPAGFYILTWLQGDEIMEAGKFIRDQ